MKPIEIVERIQAAQPELLANVAEEDRAKLVRAVLGHVQQELAAAGDGVVKIGGLGNFLVRQFEREKDGKKMSVRQVVFQTPKQKA